MPAPLRIQDLPAEEIAALLENQGHNVPASLAADLKIFIDEIGGLENACAAVEMLCELEAAA
jgi:hypothetical protein